MELFFSQLYVIAKLFCIKLLCLDLLLTRFFLTPCCCPTLCISQRCHHSELLNFALWWLEPAVPNMGQPRPLVIEASLQPSHPAPGHGHPAQWCRDSKEPEDAPDWLVTPPVIFAVMRESSLVETGQCHASYDEFLIVLVQHHIHILPLGLTVVTVSPPKQNASILLHCLWVGCYIGWRVTFYPTSSFFGQKRAELMSSSQQLWT